ncbi:amino-acid N-acetyltransferase [Spirochaeta isovalerica]|uniref:amino-acid N-acetyltransferase n=1 Tax=Spirochaeta isovalerica TaxID=150 RepID=A0A841RAE1_9SPIO|nr:amino-acid N-acetyltransferase [Spirochaeta isovalerica]MBB6479658.1 amino-acid N-acetyltransferase [Spirochaeta isovalerica]
MDNPAFKDQVSLIREVFAYTHRFKKSTFVIKLDSAIIDEPAFPVLARDISLLKGNGIRIILIAGAKERINEILHRYGIECEFHKGIRITPPEAVPFIKMAAFDTANKVMTALSAYGENAVIGNWVKARALGVQDGLDYLNTGKVEKVDTVTIKKLLDEALIPIIPSIGWNSTGIPYNVNSDNLAVTLASEMEARKLFYITGNDILMTPPYKTAGSTNVSREGRISKMDVRAAKDFLDLNEGVPNRNIISCSVEACEKGVDRVHILDGRIEGVVLKEIFSSLGSGTMIHTNIYESIRPMKSDDVPAILSLMQPLIEKGLLVKRTKEDLLTWKKHYAVYSMDNIIHGCAALIPYGKEYGEIAAITVDSTYSHLGIGRRLVSFFLERAREQGIRHIFVLTTEAADWFLSLGFRTVSREELPPEKQKNYNNKRNSRILMMDLTI